ncbi:MAG: tetratricopeptide repeat protein [candidate division WOR-3 bacterium]
MNTNLNRLSTIGCRPESGARFGRLLAVCCLLLVFAEGALTPKQTRDLASRYNKVQQAVEQGNYQEAIRGLSALVRDYGGSEFGDELRFTLAECHFNQGNYTRALEIFQELLKHPRFSYIKPEAMFGAALSYIMRGNYREAQLLLDKLAKEPGYENDPRTKYALGVLYYFQKLYPQAEEHLEGLTIPEAKFYLGKCYALSGKPFLALLKFKEITDELPNTPLAMMTHFSSGLALIINQDYDGAQVKFQFFLDQFPDSPLSDFAHYFLGCALIARKEYAQAVDHLLILTRSSNNFLAAHANYFLGYAQLKLGRAQEAVERFQRVRANYPKTKVASYAHLQLAEAMLATGDTARALLATSQLTHMFPSGELSGIGDYLSGLVYYQLGEYQNAARQFDNILTTHSTTELREPAMAMFLMSLVANGDYEKCIAVGTKYLTDYPNSRSAWRAKILYSLAEGFYYTKKYSEADNYYEQAYNHPAGEDIALYARLGRNYALYHLGRLPEAVSGFKKLLTVRPNDTLFTITAYLGYGYCLFNQKDYLKALDVFEALAKTFPENPLAGVPGLFYAGYCYYQMKYYGQAVDAWTDLMNKFPGSGAKVAEAAFRTGDTYFKALEYDKAIAAFKFVLERYPYSQFAPSAQALIAQSYYNRKRYLDAILEYQKFLDLYPSDPQAAGVRKSLEMSYYFAGKEDSSLMQEFLTRFPHSEIAAEGYYTRGKKLYDEERFLEAIEELQKVVVNFPNSAIAAEAQLLTAEAYTQLKRWTDATSAYQKFLNYFPDHPQRAGAFFNLGVAYFNNADYRMALQAFQTVVDSFGESEFKESARKNAEICRKRIGLGEIEETSEEKTSTTSAGEKPVSSPPPDEGESAPSKPKKEGGEKK